MSRSRVFLFLCMLLLALPEKRMQVSSFSLSDLITMNISCSENNSCFKKFKHLRHCECDDKCINYGDCCLDALAYKPRLQVHNVNNYACIEKTYMKVGCEDGWIDGDVSSLCAAASPENIYNSSDPLLSLPVTSNLTSVTYPNYYCAICNRDTQNLHTWKVHMRCNVESKSDWENIFTFSGWEKYDTKFNYTIWKNFNYSMWETLRTIVNSWDESDLYRLISRNTGVQEYAKSNFVFSNSDYGWEIPIKEKDKQTKFQCSINIARPRLHEGFRDCKAPSINHCAIDWNDKVTEYYCHAYIAFVKDSIDKNIYRNRHCALCNYVPAQRTSCYYEKHFYGLPVFTFLLHVPDVTGVEHSSSSSGSCAENEIFIPGYSSCNSTLCHLSGEIHNNGVCVNNITLNSSFENDDTYKDILGRRNDSHEGQSLENFLPFERNFSTCIEQKVFVSDGDFSLSDDGTISVGSRQIHPSKGYQKVEGGIIVCLTPSRISTVLSWISFIGIIVSITSLSLHLLAFLLIDRFKNLAGKNLASLCTCLLTAYILFLVSPTVVTKTINCYVLASLMYFSFFASFCWMNVIAFDTWDSFRTASQLRLRQGDQWHRFISYSLYSWLLAIIALAALVATDQLTPQGLPSHFYPELGQQACWFGQNSALLLFFVLPVFVFIILNIFFFLSTAWLLATNKSLPHENTSSVDRHLFRIHGRLAVLMGMSWIAGIIAYLIENEITWSIFVILNTLQGTFIFTAFTCHRKVWLEILEACGCAVTKRSTTFLRTRRCDEDGVQPYKTPRFELLHVSTFIDNIHQPSRVLK